MEIDSEHPDFTFDFPNIIQLAPHMAAVDNLAIQSSVIANAQAFVGTNGGLSFVPPFYGVPSLSFWSTMRFANKPGTHAWDEIYLCNRVFNRPGWGQYWAKWCYEAPVKELLAPVLGL